ncbi:DUF4286 domain-containing protein [Echinicola strongylocentroti]|uniref:DUF4286 domain-containing protein n=1 Tax=Echinicola strongylocentroti TaxID=1795355 RepID=A0A2Z4IJJ7_9BACT|nr:DUF4286 family protein [Echinicola strongylocentroti]AWW30887.1 DUF4286 domain-containing protein [Echinicola strongylocentroti]
MILYNVTVNIDQTVEKEWIKWMKEEHIPDVMATGFFHDHKFFRLLHETEDGGVNYSVQYFTDTLQKVQEYQEKHSKILQDKFRQRFQDRYAVFRSLLEQV